MMKIRPIYVGVVFACLILHTFGQHFVCNSVNGYNTKDLTSAIQWQTQTDYNCLTNAGVNCDFYLSFCQPAPACFKEYSACQNATGAANVTVLGGVSPNVFYPYDTPGKEGFYAKFPTAPEQMISNTTNCTPTLIINFNCNPSVKWLVPITNGTASAPEPTDVDLNDCLTTMTFDYDGACLKNKVPKKGMSGGAAFLIVLFCVALVYFGGGMIYNGLIQHQSGIKVIPNAQFWIGLPLYFIEGVRTTISCSICSSKPSQATYESV
ncbi:unnamed protein product [Rotaria socialis]|uniref:Autophagy-related protein 27 n=1 Tax=Rotaria socialis TaxID=392032 RepID=A0A820Q5X7_9BILA|nr:unnamed protein product [Rotaria socialis]CAF3441154.1 unnamed protein product [Rotaria socialis]CAF3708830.1 unnamed protein product [Rotaria socialis]CAF4237647.1 unnamed protein product [Rotaria socialis]CAF4416845.1 unnamed protein product [Rotaria socialis]